MQALGVHWREDETDKGESDGGCSVPRRPAIAMICSLTTGAMEGSDDVTGSVQIRMNTFRTLKVFKGFVKAVFPG